MTEEKVCPFYNEPCRKKECHAYRIYKADRGFTDPTRYGPPPDNVKAHEEIEFCHALGVWL